jgi:NADH-quinone oxidoreductase subunit N
MAFFLAAMMFSLAGVPPLAGFFAKFYVFAAAVKADLYGLAVIGVLLSAVSAYYYLRIVKIMYFDEPAKAFDRPGATARVVLALSAAVVIFYAVAPAPLTNAAMAAAKSLF